MDCLETLFRHFSDRKFSKGLKKLKIKWQVFFTDGARIRGLYFLALLKIY
jgi:hypothetical protein